MAPMANNMTKIVDAILENLAFKEKYYLPVLQNRCDFSKIDSVLVWGLLEYDYIV